MRIFSSLKYRIMRGPGVFDMHQCFLDLKYHLKTFRIDKLCHEFLPIFVHVDGKTIVLSSSDKMLLLDIYILCIDFMLLF